MTLRQLEQSPQQLDVRVATLESELTQFKQILAKFAQNEEPWWVKVAGSCENNPTFDDAVRHGQDCSISIHILDTDHLSLIQRNGQGGYSIEYNTRYYTETISDFRSGDAGSKCKTINCDGRNPIDS